VDKDLNDGTGSSQWIYIGYKRTNDPDKAIRNLLIYRVSEPKEMTHNGSQYTLVSDVNLNRHCHAFSDDLFLYYTRDAAAGDPITALYVSETPVEYKKDELGYHRTVQGGAGFLTTYIDLNRTAGGDYIYLVMVSQPVTQNQQSPITASVFSNGSWIAIAILTLGLGLMSCVSVAVVVHNKRKNNMKTTKETNQKEEG
jgi:hypothetical protein